VVGKRVVTLHLEALNDETVNLLLAGNTWSYRARLDSLGVSGAYHEADGGGEKTYYRVMKKTYSLRFEPTSARQKETTDWWGGLYRE